MMLIEEVALRLDANIPPLKGGVEYVADLSALVEQGVLPQRETAAFVIPLGFDDKGGGSSTAGVHTQNLFETIGVVLVVKAAGDAKARRALPKVDVLVESIIKTLAGWGPESVSGVFNVTRGRTVSVLAGVVIYQLDFALTRQVRIT